MAAADDDAVLDVRRCAARTFGVRLDDVPSDLVYGAIPEWDSVGHVDLMAAIAETMDVHIGVERFVELLSIADIAAFVRSESR